jgi:hypothetical protein
LATDCLRLGIPDNFRPSINVFWSGRGENATTSRRTELRRVMHSRLVALERAAIDAIEAGYRQYATTILIAAISTDEACKLLTALPTAEQLMPRINYDSIKRSLLEGPEAAVMRAALSITDDSGDGGEDLR